AVPISALSPLNEPGEETGAPWLNLAPAEAARIFATVGQYFRERAAIESRTVTRPLLLGPDAHSINQSLLYLRAMLTNAACREVLDAVTTHHSGGGDWGP